MRLLTILVVLLAFCNCSNKTQPIEKEKIRYYYLSTNRNGILTDTFKYEDINLISSLDEHIATEHFEYRGNVHVIKMYNSDNRAPVDGGGLKYTLDSIGIIYCRPIWWPNYSRLSSNNDSINDLISAAYGYMLMRKSLRCFYCDEEYTHIPKRIEIQ